MLSKLGESSCDFATFYGTSENETTYDVVISIEISGETALERFVGCFMMGIMPDEGLQEALHSLRDMLDFYRERSLYWSTKTEQIPETITATIVGEEKRPDLLIS